ncbi:MAG: hypothetical protein WCK02_08965 [Bacteroidota bacterium]
MKLIAYNKLNNSPELEFNNLKLYSLLGLSLFFYLLFLETRPLFQSLNTSIDLTAISPWLVGYVGNDGIELYVMTLAMPIFIFCAYLISVSKKINCTKLQNSTLFAFYLIILILLFAIYLINKEPICFRSIIIFIVGSIFSYSLYYIANIIVFVKLTTITIDVTKYLRWLLNCVFFVFLIFYGFMISGAASIYDYGYLIGPANKLLQGEYLGSFYMQYNLLTTLITTLMLKMHLMVNQMQVMMIFIFALWMLLYKKVAILIFKNKVVAFYFIAALLIIRGVAVSGGPISVPQVGPLRLDLWVPILLAVIYFGFESIITAIIFSLIYLLDDMFGFLYLCLYLFSIVLFYYNKYKLIRQNPIDLKTLKIIAPAFIAFIIHYIIFKTFTSPSGKIFAYYNIGFMPIATFSSFWIMVWMLPACLYFLIQDKQNKGFILFIFGLACIQLTYFFGRSHDNNLLSISGIFLLIFFLTIDTLYSNTKKKQIGIILISLFIGGVVLNYNQSLWNIRINFNDKRYNGIFTEGPIEARINKDVVFLKTLKTEKIIFMSDYDCYLNYRLGFKQTGFFSPFTQNIKNQETVRFLYNHIKKGYRLITYPCVDVFIPACIKPFNTELHKISKNEIFKLDSLQNNMMELKLAPAIIN